MSFVSTQRLDYADHGEEIAVLCTVLGELQAAGQKPEITRAIHKIMQRLDHLMSAAQASLSAYNQFEDTR